MKPVKLAATILLLSSVAASATPVCLSKHEARQLWPKQHLYWYGPNHCWSNRRGKPHNLRYDLIRENHAQAQAIDKPPQYQAPVEIKVAEATVTETKQDLGVWPPAAAKPIRVIEIVQNSVPIPVTPVEVVHDIPPLQTTPPGKLGLFASLGGGFSAILFALVLFNRRISNRVKRSFDWIYRRIGQAGKQVSKARSRPGNVEPPVHPLDIRSFLRRADRAGRSVHLAKVLDRIENPGIDPCDEWQPRDDSALACWARSIRTAQDP